MIEPDDIAEAVSTEWEWLHCHPDKIDAVLEIMGCSRDDVIIWQEFPAVYSGEKFYCSIRKKRVTND